MKGSQKISNPHDFHIHTVLVNYNEWSSLDVCVCTVLLGQQRPCIMGPRFLRIHLLGVAKFARSQNAGLIQTALSKVDNHEHL